MKAEQIRKRISECEALGPIALFHQEEAEELRNKLWDIEHPIQVCFRRAIFVAFYLLWSLMCWFVFMGM